MMMLAAMDSSVEFVLILYTVVPALAAKQGAQGVNEVQLRVVAKHASARSAHQQMPNCTDFFDA